MKENKYILLTFDYEPYLGARSGSAQKCILEPTDALREILNRHKAKGVFFVDVLYLINLKKHRELENDLDQVIRQLNSLYADGHYIFPHIHPHWLDAFYLENGKEFSLTNLDRYSLANLKSEEIKDLFRKCIDFLKSMGISYEAWGYRAGGWCIQPFSLFKDIFIEQNIRYEFSVLPGYKNDNRTQAFDFTSIKQNSPYSFSDSIETPEENGIFAEFPISTIHFNAAIQLRDRLVRKYLWKSGDRGWGNGSSAQTELLRSDLPESEMVSIELLTIAKLSTYKKYLKGADYMHWISHPKMFTKHGLKNFDSFLSFATTRYKTNFDFKDLTKIVTSKNNA